MRDELEWLDWEVCQYPEPVHQQAHRRNAQLGPAALLVQVRGVGSVEDDSVTGVEAQLERLVPLEHEDVLRIEPGGKNRSHLPAAELETVLEPDCVNPAVSGGLACQAAELLAIHLGEAPQLEPPEQVIGVVDGAVVGAEDFPGPDQVVVLLDLHIAPRALARVSEQQCGAVVDLAQDLVERLVGHDPAGPHRPLEEPVLAVAVEPRDARAAYGPPGSFNTRNRVNSQVRWSRSSTQRRFCPRMIPACRHISVFLLRGRS